MRCFFRAPARLRRFGFFVRRWLLAVYARCGIRLRRVKVTPSVRGRLSLEGLEERCPATYFGLAAAAMGAAAIVFAMPDSANAATLTMIADTDTNPTPAEPISFDPPAQENTPVTDASFQAVAADPGLLPTYPVDITLPNTWQPSDGLTTDPTTTPAPTGGNGAFAQTATGLPPQGQAAQGGAATTNTPPAPTVHAPDPSGAPASPTAPPAAPVGLMGGSGTTSPTTATADTTNAVAASPSTTTAAAPVTQNQGGKSGGSGGGIAPAGDPPAPLPTVQFAQTTYLTTEGQETDLTVSLSTTSTQNVTVDFATADGTAKANTDYVSNGGTLTFTPGTTSQTIRVGGLDDGDISENNNETFTVNLSNPTNATLGSGSTATVSIFEDGGGPQPTVQFEQPSYTYPEGSSQIVNVTLSAASTQAVTVNYATMAGTAQPNVDYTPITNGQLTFSPGATTAPLNLSLLDDNGSGESAESFDLVLSNPTNATLGTNATAPVNITEDNDSPITVAFATPTYSVNEGNQATIGVQLSSPSSTQVTVVYATSDGTARENVDYTPEEHTLTFNAGTTYQTFVVPTLDDNGTGESNETVDLTLSNPSGATITGTNPAVLTIQEDAEPPNLTATPTNPTVAEGSTSSPVVATFSDPDGNTTTSSVYSATLRWANGQTSPVQVTTGSPGPFQVQLQNWQAGDEGSDNYTLTIQDTDGSSASVSGTVTVNDAALTAQSAPTVSAFQNISWTGTVGGFTDANAQASTSDFSSGGGQVTIDWGDGTTPTSGTVTSNGNGSFSVAGTHTYTQIGTFNIKTTVTDLGGSSVQWSNTAQVVNALTVTAINPTVTEGSTSTLTLANFSDADGNTTDASVYSATLTWANGQTSPVQVTTGSPGPFQVQLQNWQAGDEGSDNYTLTIQDTDGSSASVSGTVTVSDAALTAGSASPVSAVQYVSWTGTVGSFSDANIQAPLSDFSSGGGQVTIGWGDGTTPTSGTVTSNGNGSFTVTGSHMYGQYGSFNLKTTVNDVGGSSVQLSNTAQVACALVATASNPTVAEGSTSSPVVATFSDPDGNTTDSSVYSATLTWGNGQTSPVQVNTGSPGPFQVLLQGYQAGEEGSNNYTLDIQDTDGSSTSVSGTLTVSDAALTAQSTPAVSAFQNISWTGTVGGFTDANTQASTSDFTSGSGKVTIDWGDGTTPTQGNLTSNGSGSFTVAGTHTYTQIGTFYINTTVQDLGGSSVTLSNTAQVANVLTVTASNPTVTEGSMGTLTVATFTDADGNTTNAGAYAATLTWANGQTSPVQVSTGSAGSFQVQLQGWPAGDETRNNYTLTLTDTDGARATVSGALTVRDAALTAGSAQPVSAVQGTAWSGPVSSFSDAYTQASASDFSSGSGGLVMIDWGDGTTPTQASATSSGNGAFTVSGSHTWADSGSFIIKTTVRDDGGSQVSWNTAVTVTAARLALTIDVAPLVEGAAASPVQVATFSDADGNTDYTQYSAQVTWGSGAPQAGTVSYDGTDFVVTATPSYQEEGPYPVSVTVTDDDGDRASASGTATVTDAALTGTGTAITPVAAQSFQGQLGTFSDADPAGTRSDYTAEVTDWGDGTPASGATVQAVSGGGFEVDAGHTFASAGTYSIAVQVEDAGGASTRFTTTATVAAAPLTVESGLTAVEGASFSGTVADFTPQGSGPFAATIGWGDGTVDNATLVSDGNGGYYVQGTHTYDDESDPATPYTITVTASNTQDPSSSPATASGDFTVTDAALTADASNSFVAFAGYDTGAVLLGSFTDANPVATAADFSSSGGGSVSIDWGDGGASTAGTVVDDQGVFEVYGEYTYGATTSGVVTVTATVLDDGGQTVDVTATATVQDATTSITAIEGQTFSDVVASFTADPTQAVDATIDWGDGNVSAGTITSTGNDSFTVSGTNLYADEGVYPLAVDVTMSSGPDLTASGPAVVGDAPLAVVSTASLSGTVGAALGSGPVQLVHFSDANPLAPLSDFSATVAWGDFTTDAALVQVDANGGFDVLSNHIYTANGVYPITVTISDVGGSTLTATATATIASGGGSGSVGASGGLVEGQPGTVSVPVPVPVDPFYTMQRDTVYSATLNWGDGVSTPAAALFNGQEMVVRDAHVYGEEGLYTVTATVVDPLGLSSSAQIVVGVGDAALDSWGTPVTVVAGSSLPLAVGGFLDRNPSGSMADFSSGGGSVLIDWGDGVSTPGMLMAGGSGGYVVDGSHAYGVAGSYVITATIVDDGGATTTFTTSATVVLPWTAVGQTGQRTSDPDRAALASVGEATVDLNQGAVRISQALDFDQSPGTDVGGNPALVYNSATVSARPIIQLQIGTDPSLMMAPASAAVTLTFNGVQQAAVVVPIVGAAGSIVTLSAQVATPVLVTGVYGWSATVDFYDGQGNLLGTATPSGTAAVVARDSSVYGAGWGIDGVSQLVAVAGGVLWVTGQGDSRYFASAGGGAFFSPPEDFGTLVQNGDGSYTYTAPDQTKTNFNALGNQISVVAPDGPTITYGYDAYGRLSVVQAPDGGLTMLTYDLGSGLLDSITEPGGRVVLLGHDGSGNLTAITDAAGFGRVLGYNALHQLTSDTWLPLSTAFGYDPSTN